MKTEDFRITEIDNETVKISPVKQVLEEVEEGEEAQESDISSQTEKTEQVKEQNRRFKLTKVPRIRRKLLEDEGTMSTQEKVEPLFSQSDIQGTITEQATEEELEEEIQDMENALDNIVKIVDEIEKLSNEIPRTPTKEKTASLISNKKIWLFVGVASAIAHLQCGGIAALLFVCSAVCLGVVCNFMHGKESKSTASGPRSLITENEVLETANHKTALRTTLPLCHMQRIY